MIEGVVTALWAPIANNVPEWSIFILGMFFAHELIWLACNLPYLIISHYDLFPQYKIFKVCPRSPVQLSY